MDYVALITALAGLVTAVTALVKALKGESANASAASRAAVHERRISQLETNAKLRSE